MSIEFNNLDKTKAWAKLQQSRPLSLEGCFSAERMAKYKLALGEDMHYYFAGKKVDDAVLKTLCELADEQQVIAKYKEILSGAVYNVGENRMVLHHLARGQQLNAVVKDGQDIGEFYRSVCDKISGFSEKIHAKKFVGSTGKAFDTVVQIGIGGSDLGPKALYLALENAYPNKMKAHFVSNVDPDDISNTLEKVNLETTLFIAVSKSGTTQETLTNVSFAQQQLKAAKLDPAKHVVVVTSATSPLATSNDFLDAFFIDDYIGGRYSATSAVGGVVLSLAFGYDAFAQVLAGAALGDKNALEENPLENAALLDALLGLHERNILGYSSTVVLPYAQALQRFPAHLQQVDMESNGKCVNRHNQRLDYQTGPVVWGEPGTNGQHSFYQLLHQGTDPQPLQFIGFKESQKGQDIETAGSSSQKKLNANMIAQIVAFARGHENKENPNKNFEGERPVSLIWGKKLDAKCLGLLLAHYENKVMFQGLLWNVNSFDQEGVQLGKILTDSILQNKADDVLKQWAEIVF